MKFAILTKTFHFEAAHQYQGIEGSALVCMVTPIDWRSRSAGRSKTHLVTLITGW